MAISNFVKTEQEMHAFYEQVRSAQFAGQAVAVEFETDPAFVAEMLPPCFQPHTSATGRLIAGQFHNPEFCFFSTAQLQFRCVYDGREVWYSPAGLTDSEIVLLVRREAWGESQKHGTVELYAQPDYTTVLVKRGGAVLVNLRLTAAQERPDCCGSFDSVSIKGFLDKNGHGFEDGVDAVSITTSFRKTAVRAAAAQLTLCSTKLDRWGEIPVKKITDAEVFSVSGKHTATAVTPLENADAYMPYQLGTKFDPMFVYSIFSTT